MNLEITLFVAKHFDVKSIETKNMMKTLTNSMVDSCLKNESLFNFNKTKL
jgi:hypothetical protein